MRLGPFLFKNRSPLLYGVALAVLLFLLNWLKLRLIIVDHAFEVYIGLIAVLFTALGIWMALKLARPRTQTNYIEKPKEGEAFAVNQSAIEELNLSKRELEVLELMSKGMSNQEIAEKLFVSVSTIKSHSNNLFDKMGVKRRTQAIGQARERGIIQ